MHSGTYDLVLQSGTNAPIYITQVESIRCAGAPGANSLPVDPLQSALPPGTMLGFPTGSFTLSSLGAVGATSVTGTLTGTVKPGDTADGNPIPWGVTEAVIKGDSGTVTIASVANGAVLSLQPTIAQTSSLRSNIHNGKEPTLQNLCEDAPEWFLYNTVGGITRCILTGIVYVYP